jgi:hypothetical protein
VTTTANFTILAEPLESHQGLKDKRQAAAGQALLLFGSSALAALAFCFSESFHLLNSGALDQTVRALLSR